MGPGACVVSSFASEYRPLVFARTVRFAVWVYGPSGSVCGILQGPDSADYRCGGFLKNSARFPSASTVLSTSLMGLMSQRRGSLLLLSFASWACFFCRYNVPCDKYVE